MIILKVISNLLNKRGKYKLLTWVLLISFCLKAQAQESFTTGLQGDSLKYGKTLLAQDTVFFNPVLKPTIAYTKSVNDIISFSLNEFSNILLPDSFKVDLNISIVYIDKDNATDSISSKVLTINYNKANPYNSKAILRFQNAYSVYIRINQISAQYSTLASVLPALQLENDINVDRYYSMDCTNDAIKTINDSISTVGTNGELKVYWSPNRVAEQYDLEWAWIDKSALDAGIYNTNGQPDPVLIFKNNATRVTIRSNEYSIPLLYDGDGTLFFRVRGTQLQNSGETVTTEWSSDFVSSGGFGRYDFTGHDRNLNWQSSTSFAEEGKRKSVVQYFDGSLRSRQTVTKDNTTNTTVVAETFYDKQGRPAIQVLPSPTLSTIINYTPMFNVGINGAEYDKGVYDTILNSSDYCAAVIPSMDTLRGASKYYSGANTLVNEGYNQFIPDAHGYPFAQTQYTQDNTGRIYRQGGVDNIFQIGNGHATKYYYGSPEQSDLDALFGTEAGEASHYQKNMVRDANGQYSVSYVDMNGKTIATALAGVPPDSLQQLSSFRNETETDNLIDSHNNFINGTSIQSSKSLLVTVAGPQTFTYRMASQALTIKDCDSMNICYDCLYDLNITITDNCNNQLLGGNPIVINKQNFQLFKVDTSCGMVLPMDTSFTYTLPEGEYNITKTLSISKYAMQYYHDSLFVPHNTCMSYEQILKQQMDSIKSRFDCRQPLDSTASYTDYKEQMLQDLTPPSGQYADTSSTLLYQNQSYVNNGFSIFNKYDDGTYTYQHPSTPYLNEDGNADSVLNSNGELVPPDQLAENEFIADFKDSWANSLLDKHPEYPLLQTYESLSSSLTWDEDFQKTDTYAEAVEKGYLNPTGNTTDLPASRYTPKNVDPLYSVSTTDPYTGSTVGGEALAAIQDSLFNFALPPGAEASTITKWNLATILAKCQDPNNNACFYSYNTPVDAFNTDSLCTGDLDMAWRQFRGFYESAKSSWIDNYIRSQNGNVTIIPPYIAVFQQAGSLMAAQGYSADRSNEASDSLNGLQKMGNFYQDNCTGYANQWWEQMAACNYTSADSAIIVPRLINVCELGSDPTHFLGSSSISPDSSYRFSSFEDVINQYNDSAYGGQKNANLCNSFLITKPLPYDQSAPLVNLPVWSKPDSCQCSSINNYYNSYRRVSSLFGSFSDYISKKFGISMSEGELDTLRSACNKASGCGYFTKPINLPPAFQCRINASCATCTGVQQWYSAYLAKFPGATPAMVESDTVQRNTNQVFASFMNYLSGFSYTAQDYLTFLANCSGASADTTNCSSLIWTVFNPGQNLTVNNDLYDAATDNILPVSQFFTNSIFIGPTVTQAPGYVLTDKVDSITTRDSVVIMQWRVKPASNADMLNPVIQTGNNTYIGAQWIKDPADTTWLIGSTRIEVVDGLLKGPGLQSASYGMLTDWVKITGQDTSSVVFFDDFLASGDCNLTGTMLCGKTPIDSAITDVQTSPCVDTTAFAVSTATQIYDFYTDSLSDYFNEAYTSKCLDAINLESFTVTHPVSEYHYTLYYYDQAGNLVKTIPPEGVHANRDPLWLAQVEAAKAAGTLLVPDHTMPTVYRYNSLDQVVSQNTPDAGISSFWFDRLGRLVISQNAKQNPLNNYSYTLYDYIGRITEVGQKLQPNGMSNAVSRNPVSLASWLSFNNATFDYNPVQVTSTVYDIPSSVTQLTAPVVPLNPVTFTQQPYTLRNRVSYTQYYDVLQNNSSVVNGETIYTPLYVNYTTGTYYTYDIHGNVDTLLQDYRVGAMANHGYNRFKEITYNYDLISGKVNEVDYNPGNVDQFYHRYEYDAENRITDVYTSDNKAYVGHKSLEEHEAFYQYYKHGPLARAVIGQEQVQGLDYAYTLEGWLKGVNSTSLQSSAGSGVVTDMGSDGVNGSSNKYVGQDAYSFSLNYFTGDYTPINPGVSPFPGFSGLMPSGYYKALYNGNISAMTVNIGKFNKPLLYNYQYDQLNRLIQMDAMTGLNQSTNSWNTISTLSDYHENASYDANGNIKTYLRNGTTDGGTPLMMDNLTYNYNYDVNGKLKNNKLTSVNDAVASGNYSDDIDNQAANNYSYDSIGNMTGDVSGNIQNITWSVYGKIATIIKTDGSTVAYTYDAMGNRISKTVTPTGSQPTTTWYVRDASGNTMGVYTTTGSGILTQSEQDLYGSGRLGIFNRDIDADASVPAGTSANLIGNYFTGLFRRGSKAYELSNHLGNVLTTLSDKKAGVDNNSDGSADYYTADVISANDYYPFGMGMPGRKYSIANTNYRYGFNGKEKSDEINGIGVDYDYGFRIYDTRVGRFASVDPLNTAFPFLSNYQYSSNTPISSKDIDGKESKPSMIMHLSDQTTIKTASSNQIQADARKEAMVNKLVNTLIPKLIIPQEDYIMLSNKDKQSILKNEVFNYLSYNYTEHLGSDVSGKSVLYQSITGDLNYKKLFGKHTTDKVAIFENAFSFTNSISEVLPSPEGIHVGEIGKKVLTGIEIIKNIQEGEYEKAKLNAVKAGADIGVSKVVSVAVFEKILPAAAKTAIGTTLQVITNTLTPLDAGNGSTTSGNRAAMKISEIEDFKRTIHSSMLFYFLNGNELKVNDNLDTIKDLQKENKAAKDNTSINK